MEKRKTPPYTARAIAKYNAKFDRVAVNLPKGSKAWIQEKTGLSGNALLSRLFNEYREKLEGPGHNGNNESI